MAKVEKTITINAPVENIFSYISDPTNLPEFWPSLVEIKDVQPLPNGGHSFRFVYKMVGVRLEGTSEDTEFAVNQRNVNKTKGAIESTITAEFQPEDDGTKMTLELEYIVPIPVLGKVAEAIIIKANEREFELMLANLKDMVEA